MTVKTRFAPSPTGFLHIGGARTALFSWLYARQQGGRFVLRIEDTDRERSTPESMRAILDAMDWLELDYDEGPFYQTERMDRYRAQIERLLAEGHAYRCYCPKQRLEKLRADQLLRREKPRYDGRCRNLTVPPADATATPVIRFRNPQEGTVIFDDMVHGHLIFNNDEMDDLIIARGDGSPTYNFTVVVDDYEMGISHVIRGDDHINNTPRQINIMRALGQEPPRFGHVSMILGADGKRLSKRHGAVSVMQYRDEGFLPHALLNYLLRLGWSHGDQEVFSREEMIDKFRIDNVQKGAATFNPEKLLWLNHYHLMHSDPAEVAPHLRWHLEQQGLNPNHGPALEDVVLAQRERCKTLVDMVEKSGFLFREIHGYDEKAAHKNLNASTAAALAALQEALRAVPEEDWEAEALHQCVQDVGERLELKLGKVAQPLRVAVSGGSVSPPIDQTLALVGRERTLSRVQRALDYIAGLAPTNA